MLAPVGLGSDCGVLEPYQGVLLYQVTHHELRIALVSEGKHDDICQHEELTFGDGKGEEGLIWIDGKSASCEEVVGRHSDLLSTDKTVTGCRKAAQQLIYELPVYPIGALHHIIICINFQT